MNVLEQNPGEASTLERIYAKNMVEVNADHFARYLFALDYIKKGDYILDAACGVGYGSYFMASSTDCNSIVGIDISEHALAWANKYFAHDKVSYTRADLTKDFQNTIQVKKFDVITSFETVEHIKDDIMFLKRLRELLKPKGCLILSTPNELTIPYDNNPFFENGVNPYHYRHYRPDEIKEMVNECGLTIQGFYTQCPDKVVEGEHGYVNVLVCSLKR